MYAYIMVCTIRHDASRHKRDMRSDKVKLKLAQSILKGISPVFQHKTELSRFFSTNLLEIHNSPGINQCQSIDTHIFF